MLETYLHAEFQQNRDISQSKPNYRVIFRSNFVYSPAFSAIFIATLSLENWQPASSKVAAASASHHLLGFGLETNKKASRVKI